MNKVVPPNTIDACAAEQVVTDVELMEAIRSGDKEAFASLFDRYAAAVNGVCLRILHSPTEAEAAVSDVFWEIWQRPERFDSLRGSCATYLFTLARSRAIDRMRATAVRHKKTQLASERQQLVDDQEPLDNVSAGERRQFVRQALEQIDHEQREALLLAYFEGMTHTEISVQLEKPLGTVKTHIRRGLQSLKATLKSLGGHDELS